MSPRLPHPAVALAMALVGLALCAPLAAKEPANLYLLKQEVRAYVDSGEYDAEIARVAAEATTWLEQRVLVTNSARNEPGGRLAAVFDIDETLLSNLPHMRAMDFGYVPASWDAWVRDGKAPSIKPVCELFRTARRLGVTIFILSGRREADRPGTEKNLQADGIAGYAGLYFKPDGSTGSTEAFKTAWRRKIAADGYTIILNIGDQESDLAGGYAERTFKLPDPFYLTQ
jgi:acid phosphatase